MSRMGAYVLERQEQHRLKNSHFITSNTGNTNVHRNHDPRTERNRQDGDLILHLHQWQAAAAGEQSTIAWDRLQATIDALSTSPAPREAVQPVEHEALITVESSLRFRLEGAQLKIGHLEDEIRELRGRLPSKDLSFMFDETAAEPVQQDTKGAEVWIVVKEHVWKHDDGDRPTLAYLLPAEFGRQTFPNFEAASAWIRDGDWPLGFVAMKLDAPQPVQSTQPTEEAVAINRFDMIDLAQSYGAEIGEHSGHISFEPFELGRLIAALTRQQVGDKK